MVNRQPSKSVIFKSTTRTLKHKTKTQEHQLSAEVQRVKQVVGWSSALLSFWDNWLEMSAEIKDFMQILGKNLI